MNKQSAQTQIDELKAKIAELEATISEEEINSKDLVGKLCYVSDSPNPGAGAGKENVYIRLITGVKFSPEYNCLRYLTSSIGWNYADPVPKAEVLKMIYTSKKKFGYDGITFPTKAKYVYTDKNGNIFWSKFRATAYSDCWAFEGVESFKGSTWDYISKNNPECLDWEDSEVIL